MKSRLRKLMMIVGTICMMSLAVYGCGGKTEAEPQESSQTEISGADSRENADGQGESREGTAGGQEKDTDMEELAGDVQEIGKGNFVVAEIYQETLEEGSEIMIIGAPGNEENMNLITVIYDDDTVFYKRTIRNGGADYEDSEATAADLSEGMTAEMKGSYEGEEFHASEIQLVEVIL